MPTRKIQNNDYRITFNIVSAVSDYTYTNRFYTYGYENAGRYKSSEMESLCSVQFPVTIDGLNFKISDNQEWCSRASLRRSLVL